jgi:hypothetical protein
VVGETDCVPLVLFEPDQVPEAVHAVAFVEFQVRVDDWPEVIEVGDAVSVTVGAGVDVGVLPFGTGGRYG